MTANAIINQISALAGLLGPIIGGIVYGVWGLTPVVAAGCVCFFLSAVMEIFIRIPHVKQKPEQGIAAIVKKDMGESISFIRKEQRVIQYVVYIIALFNMFLTCLIIVGIPVIIKIHLGLSSQLYGYAQGIGAAGGLVGGILTGVLAGKLVIQKAWKLLLYTTFTLIPMFFTLFFNLPAMISYVTVTVCYGIMMAIATMFSVQMLAYVQMETPAHLVGKVISLAMAVSMCAQPIGQAMYGVLFERFAKSPYIVIAGALIITVAIAVGSRHVFVGIASEDEKKRENGLKLGLNKNSAKEM